MQALTMLRLGFGQHQHRTLSIHWLLFSFCLYFFGKPEAYWTAEVDVVLNATECEGVRMQHLTMLTQRVSKIKFYAILTTSYYSRNTQNG